ncbi:MAG: hypothetical protein ACTSUP_11310 [Candidatus Heimdallarchaeaceae archaeon]
MKKFFLTTVAFSVLLLIGCQENSITDPIQDVGQQDLQKNDDPLAHQGTITLTGMLTDPYPVMNSYFIVNGQIDYEHTLEYFDPIPPSPQYSISLHLSINAELIYFCSVCSPPTNETLAGNIDSESEDIIYFSGNGSLLEKSFLIQGREDGMRLVCKFFVTTVGIELEAMWLVLPPNNNTTNNLSK